MSEIISNQNSLISALWHRWHWSCHTWYKNDDIYKWRWAESRLVYTVVLVLNRCSIEKDELGGERNMKHAAITTINHKAWDLAIASGNFFFPTIIGIYWDFLFKKNHECHSRMLQTFMAIETIVVWKEDRRQWAVVTISQTPLVWCKTQQCLLL